jgi:uncharacterized protein with von Willebrand factor type A (vWA) domain
MVEVAARDCNLLLLNKYFYKNNKSKLCFGDRVPLLDTSGSMTGTPIAVKTQWLNF